MSDEVYEGYTSQLEAERDRLLAAQQSWEEERARLTAERDEANQAPDGGRTCRLCERLRQRNGPRSVRTAKAGRAEAERDALRLRLEEVMAQLEELRDARDPDLHHTDEEVHAWMDENYELRLRLENVERLGESLATALAMRSYVSDQRLVQAWRNRDVDVS